jgi:hypothetical protein
MAKESASSAIEQLKAVVLSTREQLKEAGVAAILQELYPVVSGFDLAQSIAFGVMKQQFLAKGGEHTFMPLFEAELRKALVGM